MAESEARVSGDLVRLILDQGDAAKLLAEHTPDGKGRCGKCRSIGCTLYAAAVVALQVRARGSGT